MLNKGYFNKSISIYHTWLKNGCFLLYTKDYWDVKVDNSIEVSNRINDFKNNKIGTFVFTFPLY